MATSVAEKRAAFRRLHETGCFVIPNPWDVGSAIILQSLGYKAIASTSAGMAWALGRPDYGVERDQALRHLSEIASKTDIPLNADFENGFADAPKGVEANVALAVDTGIAGLSVEDSTRNPQAPLYDFGLAVERIAAARAAIDKSRSGVLLTGRSEGFICGRPDLGETIRRVKAYSDAGADCLYAPGLREETQIAEVIKAVAPKPVNVLTLGLSVQVLAGLGARRISVGGSLARTAMGEFLRAAREIAEQGTFTRFAQAATSTELNKVFAGPRKG
jgi:methylisocitrate lyase